MGKILGIVSSSLQTAAQGQKQKQSFLRASWVRARLLSSPHWNKKLRLPFLGNKSYNVNSPSACPLIIVLNYLRMRLCAGYI